MQVPRIRHATSLSRAFRVRKPSNHAVAHDEALDELNIGKRRDKESMILQD